MSSTRAGRRDARSPGADGPPDEHAGPQPVAEALRARQAVLERLVAIQRRIVRRTDPGGVLDAIVAAVAELDGHDIVCLRLVDPSDPGATTIAASVGLAGEELEQLVRSSIAHGIAGHAIARDALVVVEDYAAHAHAQPHMVERGATAAMAAPVREDGRVIGSLLAGSRQPGRRLPAAEQETLVAFAELASLALTDARIVGQVVHQAFHDGLTGLANRARFLSRLDDALRAGEHDGRASAVLFLDVDRFKSVNDSLGHATGDELLVEVARRLERCIRPGDVAARVGGDEFALLLDGVGDRTLAAAIARRVLAELAAPLRVSGREVSVSGSIGIALGASREHDLLRDADLAMYRAKAAGRGRVEFYAPEMHAAVLERVELEAALKRGIGRDELVLHFQPIVELRTGVPVAVEALVRWRHPDRGLLAPDAFVPLAEETGLMPELGRWVLGEACRRAAGWPAGERGPLALSVNLSGRQLQTADLTRDVAAALDASGLAPGRLTLEMTETVLMGDVEEAVERLGALKALGVSIAVDDFGTGYSSLQYLRRFPIDVLKVDRAFVEELQEGDAAPLTQTIVDLGRRLGMRVVAEGVEGEAQRRRLLALGCGLGQGFHFARPAPEVGVARLAVAAHPARRPDATVAA